MNYVKKRAPLFKIGSAKQNELWRDEIQRGKTTPGPLDYDVRNALNFY
jgi:hypothetical protein